MHVQHLPALSLLAHEPPPATETNRLCFRAPPPPPRPVPESEADHGVVGDAYLGHSPSLLCPVSIAATDAGDGQRWALQLAPILTEPWHTQPEHLESASQALNASAPSTAGASSGSPCSRHSWHVQSGQ